MNDLRLRFSVNHYLCPPSLRLVEFLDRISQYGFSGVGLTERSLRELPLPQLQRELDARQLRVSSINSAGYFLFEGDAALAQERRNISLLQDAAELGGGGLNVIVGGSGTLTLNDAQSRAVEQMRRFSERAIALGVRLLVEPHVALNARTKNCFNTLAQIEGMFAAIPGLTLNADLFHLWRDPDLDRLLAGESVELGLLQICDVGVDENGGVLHRVPLGEGVTPWGDWTRRVQIAFPHAPIELELFADQLPNRSLEEILSSSHKGLSAL